MPISVSKVMKYHEHDIVRVFKKSKYKPLMALFFVPAYIFRVSKAMIAGTLGYYRTLKVIDSLIANANSRQITFLKSQASHRYDTGLVGYKPIIEKIEEEITFRTLAGGM